MPWLLLERGHFGLKFRYLRPQGRDNVLEFENFVGRALTRDGVSQVVEDNPDVAVDGDSARVVSVEIQSEAIVLVVDEGAPKAALRLPSRRGIDHYVMALDQEVVA
jgi:hypothetical protein